MAQRVIGPSSRLGGIPDSRTHTRPTQSWPALAVILYNVLPHQRSCRVRGGSLPLPLFVFAASRLSFSPVCHSLRALKMTLSTAHTAFSHDAFRGEHCTSSVCTVFAHRSHTVRAVFGPRSLRGGCSDSLVGRLKHFCAVRGRRNRRPLAAASRGAWARRGQMARPARGHVIQREPRAARHCGSPRATTVCPSGGGTDPGSNGCGREDEAGCLRGFLLALSCGGCSAACRPSRLSPGRPPKRRGAKGGAPLAAPARVRQHRGAAHSSARIFARARWGHQ